MKKEFYTKSEMDNAYDKGIRDGKRQLETIEWIQDNRVLTSDCRIFDITIREDHVILFSNYSNVASLVCNSIEAAKGVAEIIKKDRQ
ncbi:MAG: hypothetical protein ABI241_00685 [Bacteroidia bacterium]